METRKINKEIPVSNLPCEFKAQSQFEARPAIYGSDKFKIIQVWADDKICNAHSDSLILHWRRQWLDMTTQHGQGRTGNGQSRTGTGQCQAELSKAGVGLWLNEATANWSDPWWSDDTKRTRIPSMAGSKGVQRGSARGRRAKSKAGRQKLVIVFISHAASAPFGPLFYGFLWLPLRLIVVSCVVSDSLSLCVCVCMCVCVECVLSVLLQTNRWVFFQSIAYSVCLLNGALIIQQFSPLLGAPPFTTIQFKVRMC